MPIEIGKYLVALVIFVTIMGAGFLLIADINTHYPEANVNMNLTSDQEARFDALLEEYANITDDMQDKTLNQSTSTIGTIENLVNGAYKAIKLIGLTFNAIPEILMMFAEKLHIEAIWIYALSTIAFVLVAMALIYLFMRIIPGA